MSLVNSDAGHDHARHPEEEDVVAGFHHVGGVRSAANRRVCSGQPSVEKGHRAAAEPGVEHVGVLLDMRRCRTLRRRSGRVRATVRWPQSSQYQTGMRWPHHNWRLMHHGRIFSSQLSHTLTKRSGTMWMRPLCTACQCHFGHRFRIHKPLAC